MPTVAAIKKDAVTIAQWARKKYPGSKVIAHGTSMGGACACHLGRLGLCDFLLADRTFGDLHSVPLKSMGLWASIGLRLLFEFNSDSSEDFYFSKCYKVIAQDPLDQIIGEESSLKKKVTKLFRNRNLRASQDRRSILGEKDLSSGMISKDELATLNRTLSGLFGKIFDEGLHKQRNRKRKKKTFALSRMAETNQAIN